MFVIVPAVAVLTTVLASDIPSVKATEPPSMVVEVAGKGFYPVHPPKMEYVRGEEHVFTDDQPNQYLGGVSPKLVMGPVDTYTRVPGTIDPTSVVVRSKEGHIYEEGRDYTLDHLWGGIGRIATGAIQSGQTALLDYAISLQRIDAVQLDEDGRVTIKEGIPARVCPQVPDADQGKGRIANIMVPFNVKTITHDLIYNITAPKDGWRQYLKIRGREYTSGARRALRDGGSLKIVCYGDSVTAGGSASSPDRCFVGLLQPELSKIYPKAQIEVINAGIGGTTTDVRLPNIEKEVISFRPDLVTVEFVNDMPYLREKLRENYFKMIDTLRKANPEVEIIILTPHFTRADWMGNSLQSHQVLREIAAEKKVGLGDTANIWGNLSKVGIPYQTLLANEINHPNDLGHMFFFETIRAFLVGE